MNEPDCPACETALYVTRSKGLPDWCCQACGVHFEADGRRDDRRPEVPWR